MHNARVQFDFLAKYLHTVMVASLLLMEALNAKRTVLNVWDPRSKTVEWVCRFTLSVGVFFFCCRQSMLLLNQGTITCAWRMWVQPRLDLHGASGESRLPKFCYMSVGYQFYDWSHCCFRPSSADVINLSAKLQQMGVHITCWHSRRCYLRRIHVREVFLQRVPSISSTCEGGKTTRRK